ncbi:SGNH/GDSL hydrolase family protein [Cyclobacterium amurskyense]|uniref:SGNH/GDSL hydrolase family protein n=1 Tax=Cyclobacterium amurskyense TaxID=320787 RepID=UPI0030D8EC30|tara:strand:+ start:111 stop:1277 length:1167 start_codon:yes stop_codon:yes gene_type:complete
MKSKKLFPLSLLLNVLLLTGLFYIVSQTDFAAEAKKKYGPAGKEGTEISTIYSSSDKEGIPESNLGITMDIQGESLVLAANKPGKLSFDSLVENSVVVRSTYQRFNPESKVYIEGADYTVDYANGEISRTPDSSIPDYSKHVLYGKKDFDHREYPDYSNHSYFIWVDYATKNGARLALPNDQSKYLSNSRQKLESGEPLSIVSYGNSITAGGEASSTDLRFQYLYGNYLKSIFPKAKVTIEDVSISGYSSSEGIKWWDTYIGKTTPDLVLVGWGMNDHNIGSNTPEQYKKNLIELVGMIKERKNAEVIIYSTFPPNHEWHYGSHSMELFAEAAKQAALEANCAYVDVYSTWMKVLERKDQSSLLGNNINHPNDFGHWLYEQAFEAMSF